MAINLISNYQQLLNLVPSGKFSQTEIPPLILSIQQKITELLQELSSKDKADTDSLTQELSKVTLEPANEDKTKQLAIEWFSCSKKNPSKLLQKASRFILDPLEALLINPFSLPSEEKALQLPSKTTDVFHAYACGKLRGQGYVLGKGAFAKVSINLLNQTYYACKELLSNESHFKNSLDNELAVYSLTQGHPGFLECCAFRRKNPILFLNLASCSLQDLIKKQKTLPNNFRPLPMDLRLSIFRQVADAISYLHTLRIIHRDIKPHNIMLDKDKNALLGDFGIAEPIGTTNTALAYHYAAPETTLPDKISEKLDIWALAVTIYETFKNHTPYEYEAEKAEIFRSWLHDKCYEKEAIHTVFLRPNHQKEWDELDPKNTFRDLLIHCLNGKSNNRWSATQVLEHLKKDSD